MKTTFKTLALLLLLATTGLQAQDKICPEQIAVFHLDSLIKADPYFENITFFCDGHFFENPVEATDTLIDCYKDKAENCYVKNPVKYTVAEYMPKLKKFKVPARFKKDRKAPILEVHRALRRGDKYVVMLNMGTSVFARNFVILTMDKEGNLVHKCLTKTSE